jgi:hypothetical protein
MNLFESRRDALTKNEKQHLSGFSTRLLSIDPWRLGNGFERAEAWICEGYGGRWEMIKQEA